MPLQAELIAYYMEQPTEPPHSPQTLLRPLRTEVQWSDAARLVPLGSLKYVTVEALMRQASRATLFIAPPLFNIPQNYQKSTFIVDINVVGDEEIQKLNKQYRQKDSPTDVLSFAQLEHLEMSDKSTFVAGEEVLLGDIVISLPTAKHQAEEEGHPVEEELAFLTAHAMLHLLGYDHQNDEDKAAMWEQQNIIMDRVCGWPANRKR